MPGAPEPIYVAARALLLDALDTLAPHHPALTLVGAQAIYLHTGSADLRVAEHTTDGDLVVDPDILSDEPLLEGIMTGGGFLPSGQPGTWLKSGTEAKAIDLLVPEAVAGALGRRGARIPPHGSRVARRTRGLEGALIDRSPMRISALDDQDERSHLIHVAGPAALVVAKLIKIGERSEHPERLKGKDALDILRLLRAHDTNELGAGLLRLNNRPPSAEVTKEALGYLSAHFLDPQGIGPQLAAQAAHPFEDADEVALSCAILAGELLRAIPGLSEGS
ncbi:MAG TPA: hypothetical protein V6D00_13505 [Pantanalinema sp.]